MGITIQPSNAELDLKTYSRDGKNSTYHVLPLAPDEGQRVEQVLGMPQEAVDDE